MNKKVIAIVSVIIIVLVVFFLAVILLNQNTNKDNLEENVQIVDKAEENNNNSNEVEEKTENIVLNSKIGNEIQSLIYIPNWYSVNFFKEIEASGLDDRAKIMFTFSKIISDDEYSSLRRQSQDYVGEYVTEDDLEKVASKLFTNASNLKHQEVFLPNSYDKENGNYIQLPTGFVEFSYIKDIPYKIEETENNITVYTYRLYIDCNTSDTLEETVNSTQTIYYDSENKNKALVINDEKMDDENTQTEFINEKISSGELDKNKIKQGVYKVIRKGNSYYIDDVK